MSNAYFIFNGRNSLDFGAKIREVKRQEPSYNFSKKSIYGKMGNILISDNSMENIEIAYGVTLEKLHDSTIGEQILDFTSFVRGDGKVHKLYDSELPNYYYKGVCIEGIPIEAQFREFAEALVTFSCLPKRYLKSGDMPLLFKSNSKGKILNKEVHESEPLIIFKTNKPSNFKINDDIFTVNKAGEYFINTEEMTSTADYNALLFERFPKLKAGVNTVELGDNFDYFKIIPRWFK